MISALLHSCRIREWTKNVLLFAGVLFSHHFFELPFLIRAVEGFFLFAFVASSIYLLNDLVDRERDRAHPVKKNRPIASGELPARVAWVSAAILAIVAMGLGFLLWPGFGICLLLYFVLNVTYSFKLKNMVILDVLSISLGFVIRAIAGVQAIRAVDPDVLLSPWLLVCTFFASLFLAVCKRRSELTLLKEGAVSHRKALGKYSVELVDLIISVTTAATVLAFSLYTIWPDTVEKFGTDKLIYTIPFVAYGLFRYIYLVLQKGKGGNPAETLLSDRPILVNILLWSLSVVIILYVPWRG